MLDIDWKIPLICHISCMSGITGSKVNMTQVVPQQKGYVNCIGSMLEGGM